MNFRKNTFYSKITKASVIGLLLTAGSAQAELITIPTSSLNDSPGVYTAGGYYTDELGSNIITTDGGNAANVGRSDGRNDDGFMSLDLGFDVTFFDTTYSSLFINNNGNVSFNAGISAFEPEGPTGATDPVISPFFSDVDTRSSSSGVVNYNLFADELVVTWDKVGFYNTHSNPTNSFQLVLRSDDYNVLPGEGYIGFFYEGMGWDATDTNGVAASGFGDGKGNGEVIDGSLVSGLNNTLNNKYLWFDADLNVVPATTTVPEPAPFALLLIGLAGLRFSRSKLKG